MKKILILVGPSGSGKSTLEKELVTNLPDLYHKAVSSTTRAPRSAEVFGKDYYFLNDEEFDLTPHVEVVEFAGNRYGLPESQIHDSKTTVVVAEPNGAAQIKRWAEWRDIPFAIVYLDIPKEIRVKGMKKRGDSKEAIQKRLDSDDIEERWKESGLKADLIIKTQNPNNWKSVHVWWSVFLAMKGGENE